MKRRALLAPAAPRWGPSFGVPECPDHVRPPQVAAFEDDQHLIPDLGRKKFGFGNMRPHDPCPANDIVNSRNTYPYPPQIVRIIGADDQTNRNTVTHEMPPAFRCNVLLFTVNRPLTNVKCRT